MPGLLPLNTVEPALTIMYYKRSRVQTMGTHFMTGAIVYMSYTVYQVLVEVLWLLCLVLYVI